MSRTKLSSTLALCITVLGCGPLAKPDNPERVRDGLGFQAEYRDPRTPSDDAALVRSSDLNAEKCIPPRGDQRMGKGGVVAALAAERFSPGDLIDVRVADDETFTEAYVISRDGMLRLPFLAAIPAQGQTAEQLEAAISRALLGEGFYTQTPRLSVRLRDFAPVRVAVSGAVFEPRLLDIGGTNSNEVDPARQAALGAAGQGRNLTVALRTAGGVRPDADLSAVELLRNGTSYLLDLRGAITGQPIEDVSLLAGDAIIVHSRQCFQSDLMAPSPVSPPGISLFMSNLTQPATGNGSAGIGRDERGVPYGTRMMQAVVAANCVGGIRATSANRTVALFSRNPLTGASLVIERKVEDMRSRSDRDQYDPWLLPGDAISCYDSNITTISEVARIVGIVGAAVLFAN